MAAGRETNGTSRHHRATPCGQAYSIPSAGSLHTVDRRVSRTPQRASAQRWRPNRRGGPSLRDLCSRPRPHTIRAASRGSHQTTAPGACSRLDGDYRIALLGRAAPGRGGRGARARAGGDLQHADVRDLAPARHEPSLRRRARRGDPGGPRRDDARDAGARHLLPGERRGRARPALDGLPARLRDVRAVLRLPRRPAGRPAAGAGVPPLGDEPGPRRSGRPHRVASGPPW